MNTSKRFRLSIRQRLLLLFALLLFMFTLILGLLYTTLFRRQLIDQYSQAMQRDAYAISQSLSELVAPSAYDGLDDTRFMVSEETLAPYLAMTESLTNCNVYILDTSHNVTGYFNGVVQTLAHPLLPVYLEQSVALGFMGKTPCIQAEMDGEIHLTTCMPIMNVHSQVLGVVLLESSLRHLGYNASPGITVLTLSCMIAFGLSALLAVMLSRLFTRPISQMEQTALALTRGDYEARTHVSRQDELGSLAHSMDVLAERLEESRRLDEEVRKQQRLLFANISHELRTPVTVIRGSVEALRDGIVTEAGDVYRYYEQMLREIRWLQRLIGDLLELSRLQNTEYKLDESSFDLCDLLGDVAMSARALCDAKGVVFHCEEPRARYAFSGDYARLRQMLLAVADNAVKYTSPGRAIRLRLDAVFACIIISDEGCGISAEELLHIFDRFHARHDSSHHSTGLGLTIVKEIANRHGIRLQVESTPDVGTTFAFHFPVERLNL